MLIEAKNRMPFGRLILQISHIQLSTMGDLFNSRVQVGDTTEHEACPLK